MTIMVITMTMMMTMMITMTTTMMMMTMVKTCLKVLIKNKYINTQTHLILLLNGFFDFFFKYSLIVYSMKRYIYSTRDTEEGL